MLETKDKPIKFAEAWRAPDDRFRALRERAMTQYLQLGLPHTKMEEWRSTSIRAILETEFSENEPTVGDVGAILSEVPIDEDAILAVFVNGKFSPRHSRIQTEGFDVTPISETSIEKLTQLGEIAPFDKDAFTALNTARFTDGLYIFAPKNKVIEKPIYAVFIGTNNQPSVSYQRVFAKIEANARATIVEAHIVPENQVIFANSVTEIDAKDGAEVEHVKLQLGSTNAFHITHFQSVTGEKTRLHQTNVTLGGRIVRNDTRARLNGEYGDVTLNGLYVGRGEQHIDNHTTLDHAKPNNPSFELYKGILDDRATGVFRGRIIVRPDAQKTDSKQSNMNLILSDDATVFSKPQLEIFADDVKCTHGATIGRIEDEALFYLRTRGIDAESARHLLTYAFASDVLEKLPVESLKLALENELFELFGEGLNKAHEIRA